MSMSMSTVMDPPVHPRAPYPIDDPAERRSAYLTHRAYLSDWTSYYASHGVRNAVDYIEHNCRRWHDSAAISSIEDEILHDHPITYGEWNEWSRRLAIDLASKGLGHADTSSTDAPTQPRPPQVVALLMENCPFFLVTWFALAKLGITAALINTSVRGIQLKHALTTAKASILICSDSLAAAWKEAEAMYEDGHDDIARPKVMWSRGGEVNFAQVRSPSSTSSTSSTPLNSTHYIEDCLLSAPAPTDTSLDLRVFRRAVHWESALFYIYTSGTTGPSKAALFSHRRFMGAGLTWAWPMDLSAEDRYLIVLPLYHGNGGVVAVSACIHVGCIQVVRRRFSASSFWKDVEQHRITAMIYVGELWRYLHNLAVAQDKAQEQPSKPLPSTLRVIAGNGLRPDIWSQVVERFGIKRVVEHYGMTEMPSGPYMNFYGVVGSCGFIPPDIRAEQGADKLVRYDVERNGPLRRGRLPNEKVEVDALGHEIPPPCIEITEPGEVGEGLFLLAPAPKPGASQSSNPHTEGGAVDTEAEVEVDASTLRDPLGNPLYKPYRNYTDPAAAARRVYRHVFEPLDAWFATGDLLRRDHAGFFYFVDRAGDTYRWKGENVATQEVADTLSKYDADHMLEVNVYGVTWPGQDGKAGMASIVWKDASVSANGSSSSSPSSLPPSFDLRAFLSFLRSSLPQFAIPAFLRIRVVAPDAGANDPIPAAVSATSSSASPTSSASTSASASCASSSSTLLSKTSTLKFRKTEYQKQGFDPSLVGDDLLYYWPGATRGKVSLEKMSEEERRKEGIHTYVHLTPDIYRQITTTPSR